MQCGFCLFTIPTLLKLATSPISIEKFLSPEIGSETDLKSLKSVRQPKSVIEIGSLNQPLTLKMAVNI